MIRRGCYCLRGPFRFPLVECLKSVFGSGVYDGGTEIEFAVKIFPWSGRRHGGGDSRPLIKNTVEAAITDGSTVQCRPSLTTDQCTRNRPQ